MNIKSLVSHVIPSAFALCSRTRQFGCLLTRLLTKTTATITPKEREKQGIEWDSGREGLQVASPFGGAVRANRAIFLAKAATRYRGRCLHCGNVTFDLIKKSSKFKVHTWIWGRCPWGRRTFVCTSHGRQTAPAMHTAWYKTQDSPCGGIAAQYDYIMYIPRPQLTLFLGFHMFIALQHEIICSEDKHAKAWERG